MLLQAVPKSSTVQMACCPTSQAKSSDAGLSGCNHGKLVLWRCESLAFVTLPAHRSRASRYLGIATGEHPFLAISASLQYVQYLIFQLDTFERVRSVAGAGVRGARGGNSRLFRPFGVFRVSITEKPSHFCKGF